MAIEDSLQNCVVKISQERSLGSNEWKVILPLLKQSVQKGENTCTEEIFSLVMQRPRDYANWEWDGVQNLLVELIPLLDEKDIRRLMQDIIDRKFRRDHRHEIPEMAGRTGNAVDHQDGGIAVLHDAVGVPLGADEADRHGLVPENPRAAPGGGHGVDLAVGALGGDQHPVVTDQVKSDAREAIGALHEKGITKTVLLTGDGERAVVQHAGVDFRAHLLFSTIC